MNKIYVAIFLLISTIAHSQNAPYYRSPVNHAMTLAGNVGEIRSGHFHSGIDIKATQGVGSAVVAVADGYVSRIGVAPNGYGNFMMVTHPSGTSSLYAHLHNFEKKYQDYIESEQLRDQTYSIDKYIPAGRFPVKSGERIASLGNSGSSAGPHLHFEIREGVTQNPVNIISRGIYKVPDNVPPTVFKVHLYECDTIMGIPLFSKSQTIEFKQNNVGASVPNDTILRISRPGYIAYEVIDYKTGRSNTMGVYSLTQRIDNQTNFSFKLDHISFGNTRYVNALTQYNENMNTKYHVLRAYVSPNNTLDVYDSLLNRGVIMPPVIGRSKKISTAIEDGNGNVKTINIKMLGVAKPSKSAIWPASTDKIVNWNIPFVHDDIVMKVSIESRSLYESAILPFFKYGDVYTIASDQVPLQKNIDIVLKENIPIALRQKVLIAHLSKKGDLSPIKSSYTAQGIAGKTNSFGNFKIAYDTIAPKVISNQVSGQLLKSSLIKYVISDNLSGIYKYYILIDDKWVIAAYDPKSNSLSTKITLSQSPVMHKVKVYVADNKENTTILEQQYKW